MLAQLAVLPLVPLPLGTRPRDWAGMCIVQHSTKHSTETGKMH
jgi:hypothetical protein